MIEPTDKNFWSIPRQTLFDSLETSENGLSNIEAKKRLEKFGYNVIQPRTDRNAFITFLLLLFSRERKKSAVFGRVLSSSS